MKIMFISDIHGIKRNLDLIKEKYKELGCNKLVVLGDLYYIGPRNNRKEEYDINSVKIFLESMKQDMICLRGNCDSDVDIEVSNFPIINELGYISDKNNDIYLTHGHIYNEDNWNMPNTILIYGHYHIPFIKEKDNMIFANPGSISLPKNGYNPSYMIYDGEKLVIYDIFGNEIANKMIQIEK